MHVLNLFLNQNQFSIGRQSELSSLTALALQPFHFMPRIESWVRRRVSDGIGDRADLLNAQALVATRELQLMNTKDEWVANLKQIRNPFIFGVH